ncbi:MAG: hypothetical protein K2Y39_27185 [Candidatus Obscuribacterales bacterium]|nr:hypothetical protein [Candidatus Obscuribacterales bacterium]
MRPYVIPFTLGITIGLLFSFLATALPNSWFLEKAGFAAWKVPHFFQEGASPGSNPNEGLTNIAVILRYAAFMMENGYWFLAIPTMITCGYTKLRLLSIGSEKWEPLFHSFEMLMKFTAGTAVFFSLSAAWFYTGNAIEQFTMMVTLVFVALSVFWSALLIPCMVALTINLKPVVREFLAQHREIPLQLAKIAIPDKMR